MIAIIDYGMGNLRSIQKGLELVGGKTVITSDPKVIENSDALVLPGVGAFEDATKNIKKLRKSILESVKNQKPILGICLGLQLLFTESEEGGPFKGLDLIKGRVVKLPSKVKIPQIGWNQIKIIKNNRLTKRIKNGSFVYFVHSYVPIPDDEEVIVAKTDYGLEFPSIVSKNNIFGTQFHPEKSGDVGLNILKNFVELIEC